MPKKSEASFGAQEFVYGRIQHNIFNGSWRMDTEDPDAKFELDPAYPNMNYYIFTGGGASKHEDCYYQHDIIFKLLGFIPSYCQKNCWKNVIKVHNCGELYKLWTLMEKLNICGKCGIDPRMQTVGYYAGFNYNMTYEEGMENHHRLKSELGKWIPDATIILKRGCTEFESQQPSDKWEITDHQADCELALMDFIEPGTDDYCQTQFMIDHRFREWIKYAYSLNDPTWKDVFFEVYGEKVKEGGSVYPTSFTYHDKDKDFMKKLLDKYKD